MQMHTAFLWIGQELWRRLSVLVVGCGVAIVLGIWFGSWLEAAFGQQAAFDAVKGATLASVAFALWKLLLDHFGRLLDFVIRGVKNDLRRPFVELSIVMVGLGIGAKIADNGPSPESARSLVAMSFVNEKPEPILDRIILPVFQENLVHGGVNCAVSRENEDLVHLSKISRAGREALREIACGLRACSTKDLPVAVDVQGFASAADFIGRDARTCKETDEMNHLLAEMRRRRVIELMNADVAEVANCKRQAARHHTSFDASVRITDERPNGDRWASHAEMELARAWEDRVVDVSSGEGGAVLRGREVLTRRVDLVIKDKGACEPRSRSELSEHTLRAAIDGPSHPVALAASE